MFVKNADCMLTVMADYGVLTMSYITQELELLGINYESVKKQGIDQWLENVV